MPSVPVKDTTPKVSAGNAFEVNENLLDVRYGMTTSLPIANSNSILYNYLTTVSTIQLP